jgi:hypothetical protein
MAGESEEIQIEMEMEDDYIKELQDRERAIEEDKKIIAEKDKIIAEKDKALEEALEEKAKALETVERERIRILENCCASNMSIETISAVTGLPEEQIRSFIAKYFNTLTKK